MQHSGRSTRPVHVLSDFGTAVIGAKPRDARAGGAVGLNRANRRHPPEGTRCGADAQLAQELLEDPKGGQALRARRFARNDIGRVCGSVLL